MARVVVLHVRWPEGYFTDKYPSLVISGYVYSIRREPLTVKSQNSRDWCSGLQVDLGALGSAGDTAGSDDRKSASTNGRPRSAWECWWQDSECWRQAWNPAESLKSSLGETTSSWGTLLVSLEIIATTYPWEIFKTHVFSLYSHLCIYVSI